MVVHERGFNVHGRLSCYKLYSLAKLYSAEVVVFSVFLYKSCTMLLNFLMKSLPTNRKKYHRCLYLVKMQTAPNKFYIPSCCLSELFFFSFSLSFFRARLVNDVFSPLVFLVQLYTK